MTTRVERYYQWVLILSVLLIVVAVGSMTWIGFSRTALANDAVALARTQGRITNVVIAAHEFRSTDPGTVAKFSEAIVSFDAALDQFVPRSEALPGTSAAALYETSERMSGAARELAASTDVAESTALAASISISAEALVEQAKALRIDLAESLDSLMVKFLVTVAAAGVALVGVIYLLALLFSAIRANLRWNAAALEAIDAGNVRLTSSQLKVNRFFPGSGQMADQTAAISVRFAGLVEEMSHLAEANRVISEDLAVKVDELQASRQEFSRAAQLAAIGKLAGSVSHEINNPVTGVMGYIAYARKHVDDPTVLLYLEKAAREIERIGRIAKSLLVFSRHNPRNEPLPFDVGPAVDNVVSLAGPQMVDAAVSVQVVTDGAPIPVLGHIDAFQQALLNILLNARHALLQADVRDVRVTIRYVGQTVLVEVTDTGPGIAPADRDSIFEPFFTTKPAGEGSGLGLAVTREIMQRMGGSATYDPDYTPGARFILTLQAAEAAAPIPRGGPEDAPLAVAVG